MLKRVLIYVLHLIVAAIVTTALAIICSSQNVINSLVKSGAEVGLVDRIFVTFYDLLHFGSIYIFFVLAAFLVAFPSGSALHKVARFGLPIIFVTAGAVAMLVMLKLASIRFFGVPIVGGARDTIGLILQALCGAAGGYVFHRLTLARGSA